MTPEGVFRPQHMLVDVHIYPHTHVHLHTHKHSWAGMPDILVPSPADVKTKQLKGEGVHFTLQFHSAVHDGRGVKSFRHLKRLVTIASTSGNREQ